VPIGLNLKFGFGQMIFRQVAVDRFQMGPDFPVNYVSDLQNFPRHWREGDEVYAELNAGATGVIDIKGAIVNCPLLFSDSADAYASQWPSLTAGFLVKWAVPFQVTQFANWNPTNPEFKGHSDLVFITPPRQVWPADRNYSWVPHQNLVGLVPDGTLPPFDGRNMGVRDMWPNGCFNAQFGMRF
jgi:hypothetical protein